MILNNKIRELLIRFSAGFASREELEQNVPKVNCQEFKKLLDEAYQEKDQSLFEAILWSMNNNLTDEENASILRYCILIPDHHDHETIATAFQTKFNTNPQNVNALREATKVIPAYLQPNDFKYPYLRKIIYAIGAQPEPNSTQALEELSRSEDLQIKELALHQIEKRSRLGHWEY